jgi:hypothetical protein
VSGSWWFLVLCALVKENDLWTAGPGWEETKQELALELVGLLICVVSAPDRCQDQPVRVQVDNIGS